MPLGYFGSRSRPTAIPQEYSACVQSEVQKVQQELGAERVARQMAEVELASKTNELEAGRRFGQERHGDMAKLLDAKEALLRAMEKQVSLMEKCACI